MEKFQKLLCFLQDLKSNLHLILDFLGNLHNTKQPFPWQPKLHRYKEPEV